MCVRCGEMAAEVERLQGLIDAANAQEPVIRVRDGRVVDFNPNYDGDVSNGEFFARPIPAQQSPAVAVPDDNWRLKAAEWIKAKAIEQDKVNRANPEHVKAYPYWEQKVRELNWLQAELLSGAETSLPSPRITEQDAISRLPYWPACNLACDLELGQGRDKHCQCQPAKDALNKPNGDHNGK